MGKNCSSGKETKRKRQFGKGRHCVRVWRRERGRLFQRITCNLAWLESVCACCGNWEMRLERQRPDGDREQLKDFECGRDLCFKKTIV